MQCVADVYIHIIAALDVSGSMHLHGLSYHSEDESDSNKNQRKSLGKLGNSYDKLQEAMSFSLQHSRNHTVVDFSMDVSERECTL